MSLFKIPIYKQSKYSKLWNYDRFIDSDTAGVGFEIDDNGTNRLLTVDDDTIGSIVRSFLLKKPGDTVGLVDDINNPKEIVDEKVYQFFISFSYGKNCLYIMSLDYSQSQPLIDLSKQLNFFIAEFAYNHKRYAEVLYHDLIVDCMK